MQTWDVSSQFEVCFAAQMFKQMKFLKKRGEKELHLDVPREKCVNDLITILFRKRRKQHDLKAIFWSIQHNTTIQHKQTNKKTNIRSSSLQRESSSNSWMLQSKGRDWLLRGWSLLKRASELFSIISHFWESGQYHIHWSTTQSSTSH